MKRFLKLCLIGSGIWGLTLGLHVGSLPGRVFSAESKDGGYWSELVEGKRSSYIGGYMEVPEYQVGVPLLFTFRGAEMPASITLSFYTKNRFSGKSFVFEKATLNYENGPSHDIIVESSTRSGILSTIGHREEGRFCSTQVTIPSCIEHKQDFTIEVHGFIENGENDIRIRDDVRMLYSEKKFVHLGWWVEFVRIVSRMSA